MLQGERQGLSLKVDTIIYVLSFLLFFKGQKFSQLEQLKAIHLTNYERIKNLYADAQQLAHTDVKFFSFYIKSTKKKNPHRTPVILQVLFLQACSACK